MAKIAYIRVSSNTQNTDRQEEMFKDLGIDKYYIEKVSGKNIKDRIELQKMMEYVREGDTVIVESISRFGRSLTDLLNLIDRLNEKGVQFRLLKEGDIDTTTPTGKLVYSIFSSLSEFEKDTIRQRQAEGIALAKERGAYKGRKRIEFDQEQLELLYWRWKNGEIKKGFMARKLGMSLSTLRRRIKECDAEGKENENILT